MYQYLYALLTSVYSLHGCYYFIS